MATSGSKSNQRRAPRLQLTPRGEVSDGTTTSKVLIQDISDEGLLLMSSRNFGVGATLSLKFQISSAAAIECTVQVRHSSEMGTGVKILAMGEQQRRAYEQYLQEYFSHQLGKLG